MNRSGIAAIVVLAFLPVCAGAQTASITAAVKDAAGAVVPQTRITAQNVATNAPRTVVTDDSRIYRITNLAPGFMLCRTSSIACNSSSRGISRPIPAHLASRLEKLHARMEPRERGKCNSD